MHRQDTVPQFVRTLSCRVCSSTACCSKYGCTARTSQENHPRSLRIQRHRNSVGLSLRPLWMHEQQACTSKRRERPCHQAVLCHTSSAIFLAGWSRVAYVVPCVAAKNAHDFPISDHEMMRFCTAACEQCSRPDTMLYWGGGLSHHRSHSDVLCPPDPPAGHKSSVVCDLQAVDHESTTHVPKHVCPDIGWIHLVCAN